MITLDLDEDSHDRALLRGLRANGIDFLTTATAGRLEATDEDQLAFATSVGRAIYTANKAHYDHLHRVWMETGRHHAGVIILADQRTPIGSQIRALTRLGTQLTPEEMRDRCEYLTRWLLKP